MAKKKKKTGKVKRAKFDKSKIDVSWCCKGALTWTRVPHELLIAKKYPYSFYQGVMESVDLD